MNKLTKRSGALLAVFTASILLLAACTTPAVTPAPATTAPTESAAPATATPEATDETTTPEASATDGTAAPDASAEASTAPEDKVFTTEELAMYNGQNGNPAYVAVDGVVYDVTDVPEWRGGDHWGRFTAGKDLTEEIKKQSPHGVGKLEGVPVVGTLEK